MNPFLDGLQPYPFERLNELKQGVVPNTNRKHVSLSLGEPKHQPPDFVIEALTDADVIRAGLTAYPPTRGGDAIREAVAAWLATRFAAKVDPVTQVLPVNGTREGLFSFGQAVLSGARDSCVVLPNPFYQIYEGAALLRGAEPRYVASSGVPEFDAIDDATWDRCELVYICSPGNPTGLVVQPSDLADLIERAQKHDFIIAADECYSEIYYDEDSPPQGLLGVATDMGLDQFDRCVVFHSLSKRSNCPGMRSGFVAGDARILGRYYDYRTYHGCAMPQHVQHVSALAWADESHVADNRAIYRAKFNAVQPIISQAFDVEIPTGGFYYWPELGVDDVQFAYDLFAAENITVLPGQYLGREHEGVNPGSRRIRIALVAPVDECVDAVERLTRFAVAAQR